MIRRLRRWLGTPSLQRRVGTLTAVAVFLGVALTSVAGYVSARISLYDQLDNELTALAKLTGDTVGSDLQTMGGMDADSLRAVNVTVILLKADGTTVRVPGERVSLELGPDELALARLQQGSSTRTGTASDGSAYRIAAVPLPQADGRYALVLGRPLAPTLAILDSLRIVLTVVGSIGVVLATMVGSIIARSSVRPVGELSAAVARVTQTDVLDPIEVHGNDELSELTRQFNTMLHSLASSRARQNRLIADAGHELRTPLTSLRTNIELLVADEKTHMLPEGARREILSDIAAQLAEFTSLIGDLVQLSRGDQVRPAREPVDLRDVVNAALQRVRRRGPGLFFDVELNPLYLIGEPDTLERAITNLLDNAVKFSPPGGTIRVLLEGDQLRISDQGPGIAEDDLPHIFDRFYRSDRARNTPGTGLGLSIVAQTVARHGGWVRASRSAEGGAEFTVRLPGRTTREELLAEELV
ncbi:two-component sensor histidine kinase [Enemella dayhoffiae]|uniref:histidine kinase n=1 Tax=Enemella dayhoffiae TaxID=2016507 RepID=A0A255HCK5_9ACTN|nr:HAMP domain-containing sensor histidine kinase [Enemella dayhoffiae]OYO25192.1 two-component sensor histidine kinase [Enemella dayhoffiae]